MSIISTVDKVEQNIYLDFVLIFVGLIILAITVWKGVHGFWPTTGVIVGGLSLLVGFLFNKIYK